MCRCMHGLTPSIIDQSLDRSIHRSIDPASRPSIAPSEAWRTKFCPRPADWSVDHPPGAGMCIYIHTRTAADTLARVSKNTHNAPLCRARRRRPISLRRRREPQQYGPPAGPAIEGNEGPRLAGAGLFREGRVEAAWGEEEGRGGYCGGREQQEEEEEEGKGEGPGRHRSLAFGLMADRLLVRVRGVCVRGE